MLRSDCAGEQGNPEFEVVKTPDHITKVLEAMDAKFDKFWDSMVKRHSKIDAFSSALKDKFKVSVNKNGDDADTVRNLFIEAIKSFQKEAQPYVEAFTNDKLNSYQDYDPAGFKGFLNKECPVIKNCLQSRRDALKEWQMKYKTKSGQDLLDTFANLLDFAKDFVERNNEGIFSQKKQYEHYQVEDLDDDEDLRIDGVIGSGIKSAVLFHLYPRVFPQLNRLTMYGMYFLSGTDSFGLKSKSPEFLMINDNFNSNDHNIKMDHNYWYPYGLVMLYMSHIFRRIKDKCETLKIPTDDHYRFVYVNTYFREIWECHSDHIATMMCTDEGD
jgi:hypothetical protein